MTCCHFLCSLNLKIFWKAILHLLECKMRFFTLIWCLCVWGVLNLHMKLQTGLCCTRLRQTGLLWTGLWWDKLRTASPNCHVDETENRAWLKMRRVFKWKDKHLWGVYKVRVEKYKLFVLICLLPAGVRKCFVHDSGTRGKRRLKSTCIQMSGHVQ